MVRNYTHYNAFVIFVLLYSLMAGAQQTAPTQWLPNVVPPSPTVANLMAFEEVPVDNYTGQPDITIPLYSKQLNSELSLPIVLKYSTSGVRIENRSGWVGTGWSLDAGGVVSRTVRSIADEHQRNDDSSLSTGVFHNPEFWMYDELPDFDKNEFKWNVNGTSSQKYDAEPDLFQFSFMGMSGRFLVENLGAHLVVRPITQDQKFLITVEHNSNFEIKGFVITDPNGYKYYFAGGPDYLDYTEVTTTTQYVIASPRGGGSASPNVYPETVHNSAWHLKKITTSNGATLVDFEYTGSTESYTPPTSLTFNNFTEQGEGVWGETSMNGYSKAQFRPSSVNSGSEVDVATKKLSHIIFRDKTKINFSLGSTHTETNGKYLTQIAVESPLFEVVKYYNFTYETAGNRLWLLSLDGKENEDYFFEYNAKDLLPPHNGKKDGWGFNKSDYRDTSPGFYKYEAVTYGLIYSITYPTGGVRKFTFEQGTFSYEGDDLIGNFDDNPGNTIPATISHDFLADTKNLPPQTAADNFTLNNKQYVYVDAHTFPYSSYENIIAVHIEGPTTRIIDIEDLPKIVELEPGAYTCKVRVKLSQTLTESHDVTGFLTVKYVKPNLFNYKYYLLGGGPRIKTIEFFDPNDTIQPLKSQMNYEYDHLDVEYDYYSSGSVDARLGNMKKEYYDSDRRYLFHEDINIQFLPRDIGYHVVTDEPNIQLSKGNYVGYKRVKVSEYTSVPEWGPDQGYTEYTYTTAQDFPQADGIFDYPFQPAPNLDYKRGLLLSKTVYAESGEKLQEQINSYDYIVDPSPGIQSFTITPVPNEWRQFYEHFLEFTQHNTVYMPTCGTPEAPTYCLGSVSNSTTQAPYNMNDTRIRGARAQLVFSVNKEYFGGTVMETTSAFTYNPDNYQLATKTDTISEGTSKIAYKTEYQYPFTTSYTASYFTADEITEMANMVTRNIINKPVMVINTRNGSTLSRTITKYDTFATGQILPKEIETLKGTQPAEDRVTFYAYNPIGNVREVGMANGSRVSYVWGYYDTLPVAKIENCNYGNISAATINTIATESMAFGSEANLRTALNSLRTALANSQVTTIIYDTLKGAKEITDPRGLKQTFIYEVDGLRLEEVRDNEGKLLTEYQYNFRQ